MGYIPDWQRQSAAKNQPQSTAKAPTKFGVVSKPIFHAEKALHSQGTQTPFTRHYADGPDGEVGSPQDNATQAEKYNLTDKGLLGGEIKYREENGRKYVEKKDPLSGRTEEQRYYSGNDIKEGFKSLFSSKSKPTETLPTKTVSSSDAAEKDANMGSPAKTSMQSANDSYTKPKGVFGDVDEAVKSATKVSDDTGNTTTIDYSTRTRSNSATKPVSKPVGRKDVPGSDAMSFPLKSDTGDIGNQTFPRKAVVANSDLPSKPYPIKSADNDSRSSRSAPLPDYAKEASDAGVKFAALTNHVKSLPAGTSPGDRAKAGQLMREAQTDYEAKSARIKRS